MAMVLVGVGVKVVAVAAVVEEVAAVGASGLVTPSQASSPPGRRLGTAAARKGTSSPGEVTVQGQALHRGTSRG